MPKDEQAPPETLLAATQDRLISFILARGGTVSFDQFMAEVLYGQLAYYQERVTIGTTPGMSKDFCTHSGHPLFAELLARYVLGFLQGRKGFSFIELGGGEGTFKQRFIACINQSRPTLPYVSVDISRKLIGLQQAQGGVNIRASALSLPLKDRSLQGIVFANELVDAFPLRIIRANGSCFEELFYIVVKGDDDRLQILPEWQRVKDPAIFAYLKRQGNYDFRHHTSVCVNLYEELFIQELARVMNRGRAIIVDYGDTIDQLAATNGRLAMRMFPRRYNTDPQYAFLYAYHTDITANVNFTNLQMVAEDYGFRVVWYGSQGQFLEDQLLPSEKTRSQQFNPLSTYNKLPRGRSNFKVLILEK